MWRDSFQESLAWRSCLTFWKMLSKTSLLKLRSSVWITNTSTSEHLSWVNSYQWLQVDMFQCTNFGANSKKKKNHLQSSEYRCCQSSNEWNHESTRLRCCQCFVFYQRAKPKVFMSLSIEPPKNAQVSIPIYRWAIWTELETCAYFHIFRGCSRNIRQCS